METGRGSRAGGQIADALTGQLLDRRYLIGPRVARGGMASVYEATDTRLDRLVAVKVMHPGLGDALVASDGVDASGDAPFADRFVREARASARLTHEHIVGVYDQGEDNGIVYLVMEYVPGHTLRDVIRQEAPLSPHRALALIDPVLSALAAAHRSGLMHRDVKPENVLIADDGRVKVADFGLAKAVSADTQHTATGGVLIGTVSYLAPELVVDGRADARADVYATGVVLYELLTGHKPHEGESPIQVAYKHVHEDIPPPSRAVAGIPGYVDALVARATSRDRDLRPADAGVFLLQVRRVRQALAAGVVDDPELTADLTPLVVAGAAGLVPSEPSAPSHPWEEPEYSELFAELPATEPTTSLAVTTTPPPPEAADPDSGRRSRRGPAVLIVALLLMALLAGGAWWFGDGRFSATPGLIGMSRAEAKDALEKAGLTMDLAPAAYSETVPAGEVMSTDPNAGSRVLNGGTVTVVLSLGKERHDVPKLRGKTEDEAQDAILAAKLTLGETTERFDDKVAAGVVISSSPAAGTSLKPDALVDLVISKGKRPIKVVDWTGKNAERASRWMDRKGLSPDISTDFSDTVPEGRVISQTPTSGTLYRGDPVSVVVSKGPELIEVPSGLRASGVDAAEQKLTDLGFKVKTKKSDGYLGLGYVFSVDPGEGTLVAPGSTVTLYLV